MRQFGKVDLNQFEIVQTLRDAGCCVQILSMVGGGCPDILVSRGGEMILCELKSEKGKLNDEQKEWHAKWKAPVVIARTVDDALKAMNAMVRRGMKGGTR